jgi:hypothetical protein
LVPLPLITSIRWLSSDKGSTLFVVSVSDEEKSYYQHEAWSINFFTAVINLALS